jgi:hypothetical protein
MYRIIIFSISALLLIIAYQDFKFRAVNWIVFPLLALLSIIFNLLSLNTLLELCKNSMINLIFITVQFLLLYLYFILKIKKIIPLTEKIGLGDLLFLCAVSFLFSPVNFIFFYIFSLITSLCIYGITSLIFKKNNPFSGAIPLAGLQSLFLFIFILATVLFGDLTITNDNYLLNQLFPV